MTLFLWCLVCAALVGWWLERQRRIRAGARIEEFLGRTERALARRGVTP